MIQLPYYLDPNARSAVLAALREVCSHRGWPLLAAHVRTTHVHAVVEADVPPEKVMNDFKSYATRCLNRLGRDSPDRRRWARHGSTRCLWKDQDVRQAIKYVVEEQGEPTGDPYHGRALMPGPPLAYARGSATPLPSRDR